MPEMDRAETLLRAALTYAARGWAVFPIHTPLSDGAACSCRRDDCSNIGKHPRTRNGFKDASTDPAQIEKWWGMWPDANIAIACGPSGLTVIDVDPRHGGDETFRDLVERYGRDALTETVIALTGNNGNHYYFAASDPPLRSSVGAWQGVDIRGHDGYVVAPPSLHESGRLYEWERPASKHELAPFPAIAIETRSARAQALTPGAPIPVGKRDDTLASLAGAMRQRGMSEDSIYAALRIENAERCTPPLPDSDLRRIARSVARYEPSRDIPVSRAKFTKTYANLRKIDTKPPSYVLTVMGLDVRIATMAMLKNHSALQTEVAEQTNILVASLTKREWEAELGALLESCTVIPAPDDASDEGIAQDYIREYLALAEDNPRALLEGRPVRIDGQIYTTGAQLRRELGIHGFKLGQTAIWGLLAPYGVSEQRPRLEMDGKAIQPRVWALPATVADEAEGKE